jgi:hypothetical protein
LPHEKRAAGIVASFAAADRRDLATDDASGTAVSLRCPGCSAPLEASPSTRQVKCRYCRVLAWVPDSVWSARDEKEPIWLVLRAS